LDSAPGKSTVEKWFAKLKRGEICIEGDARSGRPKEAVFDENIKKSPQNNFEWSQSELDRDSWDSKDIKKMYWTYCA
jgi:transposase